MIGPGEVLAGLNILEKVGKSWNWLRGKKSTPVESVSTRFVRLFESHGVHRNQIPRFLEQRLTLQDVQDDAVLLAKLDETLLESVCNQFAVRQEWLDGAESQIYPCHDFYKQPKEFAAFLENLKASNPDGDLHCTFIAPKEHYRDANALLILQETVGHLGDNAIYRYHLCNNWVFAYWKCRAYLTACIAIACKHQIYVHGIYVPAEEIQRLAGGEVFWVGRARVF